MTSRRLQILSVVAVCLLLAAGFLFLRHIPGLALTALAGLLWFIGIFRAKIWVTQLGFVCSIASAVLSTFAGAAPTLSLGVVLFALAGWDLSHFAPRIESIHPSETALRLQKLHLRRLGLTLGTGAVAGLAANLIHIELSFSAAVALGLVAFLLLALSARELERDIEKSPDSSGG